ncbi:hypothetical protein JOD57_002423 [Geodermatophilus bullaregiensis]|uniref:DUF6049 family protein n=1 Tax=Geodermatophilus bullaregiensis TaxID=1564160 RepID=UPI001959BCA0|nr:DUF6049 family protein [Geodermatophilus bullaregiensis]MBM7806586.1 hypothetical protein [Geodermatophilus bullaregiensis]
MTLPVRPSRTRWPRVLTTALLALPLLAVPPVAAVPPAAAAPPPTAPAPAADDDRPVTVEVTRLEPRTVAPGGTVTVEGTLTNTGTEALTDLTARLQRGEVVTTRADLLAADAEADAEPETVASSAFAPVASGLGPGEEVPFTYTATTADLALDRDGVYPVLLNVNATGPDGAPSRVGEVSTSVVQQTAPPATATAVAWLWPLVERTHRDASGAFVDDDLAAEVSDGGRLDRALAVVERVPEAVAPGATEPSPVAPVTLAVDPVLVEELALMAEGPYDVAGDEDAGTGTDAAAAWLDRLRAVAADHPVVALPYGDVDADALQVLELPAALTRSLPGAGGGGGTDGDGTGGTGGTGGGTANGGDAVPTATAASPGPRGVALVAEELGVQPRTDVAWAAGGALRADTLATLQDGGIEQVVLASGSLSGGDAVRGLTGAAAARTTVTGDGGPVTALVADSGLSGLVGAGATGGGVRVAEQRYLAELVLLSRQPVADPAGQTVLVAPPRDVDPDPDGVAAMIADTALPGLRPASLAELATGPGTDAGTPLEPAGPVLLDAAGLADVVSAAGLRDDLAGAVVDDPVAALAPTDAALARTVAVAWREDPEGFRAAAADLRQTAVGLRRQVTLLAPAEGSYSLASSDAPLVLTVQNDLPFAVRVVVDVRTRDNVGLTIGQVGAQEVAPQQRTTLTVPTEVRQSGRFAVSVGLTTPGGGRLGDPVAIQVRSTAYGTISLSITIGAAVLLGLLFLRRGVLFVLRRRRGAVDEDLPADAWPPSRSPV